MDNQLLVNLINRCLAKIKREINSQINEILNSLSNYVVKDGDKTLSDNNFSDNYKKILDDLVANGIDVTTLIDTTALNSALANYVTLSVFQETLTNYSTTNDINELLSLYIKTGDFHSVLTSDTELFNYLHNDNDLETDPGLGFITSDEVDTIINNLVTGELNLSAYAKTEYVDSNLDLKVDKVEGKDLSTNDFTNNYKTLLDHFTIQEDGSLLFNGEPIGSFDISIVTTLPTEDISTRTIYFIKDESSEEENNIYIEYIYVNGAWEIFGQYNTGSIDLSNYVDTTTYENKINEIETNISNNTTNISSNATSISNNTTAINKLKTEFTEYTDSLIKLENTYNEW